MQASDKQAVALFKIIPYCHMQIGKATLCKLIYIKVVIKLVVEYVLLLQMLTLPVSIPLCATIDAYMVNILLASI